MITGGNATIFVTDFERSLAFYTDVLGMTLRFRAENHWAEVVAGNELVIGIHPAHENYPAPGTQGSMQIGLVVDGRLEDEIERLSAHNVEFTGEIMEDGGGALRFQYLKDPDGNVLYLWEQAEALQSTSA